MGSKPRKKPLPRTLESRVIFDGFADAFALERALRKHIQEQLALDNKKR